MNKVALSKSADIGRIVREDIQQILDEKDKTSVIKLEPTYKSVFNQPERLAISSASAIPPTEITSSVAESGFYSFVVNLPRPALNVKNLQLLSANIPQAQVSIPDDSLVFWYYRLQTQNIRWPAWSAGPTYNPGDLVSLYNTEVDPVVFIGNYRCRVTNTNSSPVPGTFPPKWTLIDSVKYESPNLFNLQCIRLLPSYYKQEIIVNPQNYGYNQTFNTYQELATQLSVACSHTDLAVVNKATPNIAQTTSYTDYMPVSSYETPDISITFDDTINKFKFKGLHVNTPFDIPVWDATTLYQPQSLIKYGSPAAIYFNISAEFGNPPDSVDPLTSWTIYFIDANTVWNTYLAAGYNDPNVIKLQGIKTTLDWNEYHRFLPNSHSIYYKGNYWAAEYVNQNEPPPIGIWNADISYSVGDVVYYDYDSFSYICIVAPGPAAPLWNSTTKYYLGDTMTWEDATEYEAATNYIPVGWSPGDGALVFTTWDYQQFNPGDIVTDPSFSPSSTYWICTAQTTGLNPLDYPAYTSFDYYIVGDLIRFVPDPFNPPFNLIVFKALDANHYQSPYEYPSRWERQDTVLPPEQASGYWQPVTIPDPPWITLGAAKDPSNATYWTETYNPWIPNNTGGFDYQTGVNYVSKKYDFILENQSESLYGNNIYGIPGQPFIDTTQQASINNETLNKRLGFSWMGQNMLIPFTTVVKFNTGSLVTLFYNRLRPIPSYNTKGSELLEELTIQPNLTADQQATYTADAFCNLVYSSIINIYTRILGGSTTDTVRNTNLLAIVPMSCGNLGVTLFNSFIDNPLTKIDTDIYTIEVQFRTESGQPYWLSNNAVVTLQLKMGYD